MQGKDFHGLSNQQIVFLYLVNKSTITKYTDVINRRGYTMPADIPGLGRVLILKEVSQETIERVQNSPVLKQAQEIYDTLHPVVELIKESSEPDYQRAKEIFEHQLELS